MSAPEPAPRVKLFTALVPASDAVADLRRVLEPVRTEVAASEGAQAIRWVPPDLWHVTLVFLGWVAADREPAVRAACAAAAAESVPFEWRLESAGGFPSAAAARVLWMGVEADGHRLRRLFRAVRREVRAVRIDVERRPFHAHATIARISRARADSGLPRPATAAVTQALRDYRGPAQLADRVVLMRSHPGRHTWYETLGGWPLGPAASGREPEP